ncbi:hypothetical protein H5410_002632 [Solanum commersonii]|uniref:Uncharacterized protein n=1 Tax=Solanum commersonii TaxID=4109 RepID=A0A9J6B2T0_SOLCO|nr:hypothetical protein H5410_002632 [Solanum commersonii]
MMMRPLDEKMDEDEKDDGVNDDANALMLLDDGVGPNLELVGCQWLLELLLEQERVARASQGTEGNVFSKGALVVEQPNLKVQKKHYCFIIIQ